MRLSFVAFLLTCSFTLTGCITLSEYRFSFDYETGKLERVYHDLRSKKGPSEEDYSVENDWAHLKKLVADEKPEFDPDVVKKQYTELFEKDGVLCGRQSHVVGCPKCFPSKVDVLAYVEKDAWHSGRYEEINGEIILFLPGGKKTLWSNGRIIETNRNTLIVWEAETNRFEYLVRETSPQNTGGEPLLPFFLKEQDAEKQKKTEEGGTSALTASRATTVE